MSPVPEALHVAVASLNQTVGDWAGNAARIAEACAEARRRGAVLLALPEMCVSGYSLGDRVAMRGTLERSWRSVVALLPETRGLVVTLGLPVAHDGALFDAIVVVADGRPVGVVPKENLATGDVEYENRWYAGWRRGRVDTWEAPDGTRLPFGSLVFDAEGIGRFAVEICEDGWKGVRPGSLAALAGAHVVINASASWFELGKHATRRHLVEAVSREDRVAYLYTSLVGCDATRLVFDGSTLVGVDGRIVAEGPRFVFTREVTVVDVVLDLAAVARGRLTEGSWRSQRHELAEGTFGAPPQVVQVEGTFGPAARPPAGPPYWERRVRAVDPSLAWVVEEGLLAGPLDEEDLLPLELELALCTGLRDYLRKTGVSGVAVALSGGRDSAMCALLAARAVRYARPELDAQALRAEVRRTLVTAYLATAHSGDATRDAAAALAEELGAEHLSCDLQAAVDLHHQLGGQLVGETLSWDEPRHDVTLQNVQARLRGSLIWMVANVRGRLLLTTSNKSEAAVGYTTMDGDTAGGLAPIADVPKSLVSTWLAWAARRHGLRSLEGVLATPATAELRPSSRAQTDEDDLMPFAVLDRLMFHFAFLGEEPAVMFERLWPELAPRYQHDPRAFGAHVRRFVGLFCRAQWKRERFAISFRVTAFDLDPKTGFRFPPVQAPFAEELADLDLAVEAAVAALDT
ncbi:MAG: NAD(+) synthase [Alphaproteobacteria bacterium]|nr:NAD(+) synthase [Alphaproteobacteria bacterium]